MFDPGRVGLLSHGRGFGFPAFGRYASVSEHQQRSPCLYCDACFPDGFVRMPLPSSLPLSAVWRQPGPRPEPQRHQKPKWQRCQ